MTSIADHQALVFEAFMFTLFALTSDETARGLFTVEVVALVCIKSREESFWSS